MAAAVYGASRGCGRSSSSARPGGQAGTSSRIENYLGFPSGVSGDSRESRAPAGAKVGAEIWSPRSITGIDPLARRVHLDGGDLLQARTIILACGVAWRRLAIDGSDRLAGKGISYGAARSEAPATHGLDVHVIGAGNSAGQSALFFSAHARSVTILCRGDSLGRSMSRYLVDQLAARSNIGVLFATRSSPPTATTPSRRSTSATPIRARPPGSSRAASSSSSAPTRDVLAAARDRARPARLRPHRLGRDCRGPLGADRDPYLLETSVPGVFAAGDVRFSPRRVAAAVGEGSMAIAFVHQYLKDDGATP